MNRMGRMLIYVPRLYTKEEFKRFSSSIPEDYETKSEEFWGYVEEKLNPLIKQVKRIYLESLYRGGMDGIKIVEAKLNQRNLQIVKMLIENGAELHATESSSLISETSSWLEIAGENPNLDIIGEIYRESLSERDKYIANVIDQTLKTEEVGVIFIEPTHNINLPKDIKVIKMCRFDPSDYLNIWIQKLKLRT